MILTVTLNAALDITYQVDRLRPGEAHRVLAVAERAGGKGVNVARVLHALNVPVVATGLVGGSTGAEIRSLLDAGGVRHLFVDVAARSRRTVVVTGTAGTADGPAVATGSGTAATGFWEPGPVITAGEWAAFVDRYRALLAVGRVVVLSGSLPPGTGPDGYARLITLARAARVPVLLDADGEALRRGVAAGPAVVKPNAAELAAASGVSLATGGALDLGAVVGAAEALRAGGGAGRTGTTVVASLGADGLVAVTPAGRWRARAPVVAAGNATGAGDACVAALARSLLYRRGWPEALADAAALSAAAVLAPVAGAVVLPDFARLRRAVTVRAI